MLSVPWVLSRKARLMLRTPESVTVYVPDAAGMTASCVERTGTVAGFQFPDVVQAPPAKLFQVMVWALAGADERARKTAVRMSLWGMVHLHSRC
jgi:hypothetical protein